VLLGEWAWRENDSEDSVRKKKKKIKKKKSNVLRVYNKSVFLSSWSNGQK
jgi:hypothetical protein